MRYKFQNQNLSRWSGNFFAPLVSKVMIAIVAEAEFRILACAEISKNEGCS